jgi:spore coat protein H
MTAYNPIILAQRCLLFTTVAISALTLTPAPPSLIESREPRKDAYGDRLFGLTNIWTVEISVSAQDWEKIELNIPGPNRRQGLVRTRSRFEYAHAEVSIGGKVLKNVGLRHKGNGAFGTAPKHPFKIDFDKYVDGQAVDGITRISLNNNVYDTSKMREALSYDLFRQMNVPAPRTAFAKIYLSVPHRFDRTYLGLYSMVESVESGFLRSRFGNKNGLLLKPDLANGSPFLGDRWERYRGPYQQKTKGFEGSTQSFIDYTRLVNKGDNEAFAKEITNYIDLDEFLRFLAVNTVLANLDSFLGMGKNFYIYLDPESRKLSWIPWDLDLSFGAYFHCGNVYQRINLSIRHPYSCGDPLVERLLSRPEIEKVYREHLQKIVSTAFSPATMEAKIDAVASVIRGAVEEEHPGDMEVFERSVFGSDESAPKTSQAVLERVLGPALKPFVSRRVQSVQDQLAGKEPGSTVSFWNH